MLTLLFQGMIKGNLKPEYFMYAMVVSFIFCVWAFVDHKMRKLAKRRLSQQNSNT
jgi:hypothetical protein